MRIYRPKVNSSAHVRPARARLGSGAAFREQKTGRRRSWWRFLFFFCLGGGVVYSLFFSPLFRIRHYRLILSPRLPSAEIRALTEQVFTPNIYPWQYPRRTVWAYPKKLLQQSLKNVFEVREVDFDYRWFVRELVISVTEREPALAIVWPDGKSDIYDQDQKFLENLTAESVQDAMRVVFVKFDGRSFPIVVYPAGKMESGEQKQIFSPEEWVFWQAVWEQLRALGLEVRNLSKLELIIDDVKSIMTDGYEIIWDPAEDIEKQFSRLKVILGQVPDKKTLHYIDVRFEGKVIYQ